MVAIQSFYDKSVEKFFLEGKVAKGPGWANVKTIVRRKLDMLHYAKVLSDLQAPPNNRLEALQGSLDGLHSIRVNDQWRVVFRWTDAGPADVRVVDYH